MRDLGHLGFSVLGVLVGVTGIWALGCRSPFRGHGGLGAPFGMMIGL